MRIIDKHWEELFAIHNILRKINDNGFCVISSQQINDLHEARLMTKFDSKVNLPQIFLDNQVSILPISRGNYILGNFDAYKEINYEPNIKSINFTLPEHIESIDYNDLYSESSCLHCAYISGILDDIAGEKTLPTISGRMSGGQFDFNICNIIKGNTYPIKTQNSQIEIDGGFESLNKLIIIEAKNFTVDNFLIRQLYYPYRLWNKKVNKEIIPVFMTFSNDIFSFFIYKFKNNNEYNSIELVQQKNYIISSKATVLESITLDDIYTILTNVEMVQEPKIPFPQADSMPRIVDLLSILTENSELTSDCITTNYSFTERQTSYYTSAAMYLGLIDKKRDETVNYFLTDHGRKIMRQNHKQKYLSITEAILKHEVFNKVLKEYFQTSSPVLKDRIVEIMNSCPLYNVGTQETVIRRAQTVIKWIEWILDLQAQ